MKADSNKLKGSNILDFGVWTLYDALVGVAVGLGKFQSAFLWMAYEQWDITRMPGESSYPANA